jgi:hypothetical protein
MNTKKNMNLSQLARNLGWVVRAKEYQHLTILLNYMPLNQALKLLLGKEGEE